MRFPNQSLHIASFLLVGLLSGSFANSSEANSSGSKKKPPTPVYYLPGFKILIKPKPAPEPPKSPTDDLIIVRPFPFW
jgi:hypothetical protein